MSDLLMLADQAANAIGLVERLVQIGSRLGAHGMGCLYLPSPKSHALPNGVVWGYPELGIPGGPCWLPDDDDLGSRLEDMDSVLREVRMQACLAGLVCQTEVGDRYDWRQLQLLLDRADLIVAATPTCDAAWGLGVRRLVSLTTRPLLVAGRTPWSRVVVMATDDRDETELLPWARAWAACWKLDVAIKRWLPKARFGWRWPESSWLPQWKRQAQLPEGIGSKDLVLVARSRGRGMRRQSRQATVWEILQAETQCSLGVGPLYYTSSMTEWLHTPLMLDERQAS